MLAAPVSSPVDHLFVENASRLLFDGTNGVFFFFFFLNRMLGKEAFKVNTN